MFYLEIALNAGDYLTVRRPVENNVSIAMKRHEDRGEDFSSLPLKQWDHVDLTLTAARDLLDGILDLKIVKPYSYRMALSYFLRTQEDYNDVLQLQKFVVGQHVHWKPFVMTLLGFKETPVLRKYQLDGEIDQKTKERDKKQAELQVDENDISRLSAEIQNLRSQLNETEAQLDRFEFSEEERRLTRELVDVIEAKIADINDQLYNVRVDIRNIDSSLSNKMECNLAEVEEIFRESALHFPG